MSDVLAELRREAQFPNSKRWLLKLAADEIVALRRALQALVDGPDEKTMESAAWKRYMTVKHEGQRDWAFLSDKDRALWVDVMRETVAALQFVDRTRAAAVALLAGPGGET